MATVINKTGITPCLLLQNEINKNFGALASDAMKPNVGLYNALISDANRVGVSINEDVNNGQARPTNTSKRIVQLRYVKPTCTDESVDAEVGECVTPDRGLASTGYANVEVNDFVSFGFELNDAEFDEMCASRTTVYTENLMSEYYKALKRLDKKLLAKVLPTFGNYPNGDSSLTETIDVPFINANGTPNIGAFAKIQAFYRQLGYPANPIFVGDSDLLSLEYMQKYLGQGANGINLANFTFNNFFFDAQVNAEIGDAPTDKRLITFAPGTYQFVNFLDTKRREVEKPMLLTINGEEVTRFEKENKVMSLEDGDWDFYYTYDCGKHNFNWQKRFDLFSLPSDAVCNYPSLLFGVDCGDLTCTTFGGGASY